MAECQDFEYTWICVAFRATPSYCTTGPLMVRGFIFISWTSFTTSSPNIQLLMEGDGLGYNLNFDNNMNQQIIYQNFTFFVFDC